MRRFVPASIALVLGSLVSVASPSQAATTTIGSDLTAPANQGLSCIDCTVASLQLGGASTASPVSGVIVRWRVKAGGSANQTSLRVLRPSAGGTFDAVGTSAIVTPSTNTVNTFETRLPIQAGDFIGIDFEVEVNYFNRDDPTDIRHVWIPQLGDDDPPAAPVDPPSTSREVLVNADVEPDGDGDGFGDDSQDQCVGTPGPDAGCPTGPACTIGDPNAGIEQNLRGTAGDDVICGGPAADNIRGGGGNDTILGGGGSDNIRGDDGNDTLNGGDGDDNLLGGSGNDVINGGAGDDNLNGEDGTDTLDGGADTDNCKKGESLAGCRP